MHFDFRLKFMDYEIRRCLHFAQNVEDQFEVVNASDPLECQIITWTKYKGKSSYIMQSFSNETKKLSMDGKFSAFWTYVDAFQNVLSCISSASKYEQEAMNAQQHSN